MKKIKTLFAGILATSLLVFSGCSDDHGRSDANEKSGGIPEKPGPLTVVATIGMISDMVEEIGRENVEVTVLAGAGVDPHMYKPTPSDIKTLKNADIIFYNGIELEARMADAFVSLARNGKKTFPVTENIDPKEFREPEEFEGKYDSHVWQDVLIWKQAAQKIEKELTAADPKNASEYEKNAEVYYAKLDALHKKIQAEWKKVPKESRVLITAHDAFGYYGLLYGIEIRGIQGISTESEASARDIDDLADFIVERNIKAIFAENIVSGESIRALQEAVKAKGGEVKIGGELLSDSLGEKGTKEGTYIGMMESNLEKMVNALK